MIFFHIDLMIKPVKILKLAIYAILLLDPDIYLIFFCDNVTIDHCVKLNNSRCL